MRADQGLDGLVRRRDLALDPRLAIPVQDRSVPLRVGGDYPDDLIGMAVMLKGQLQGSAPCSVDGQVLIDTAGVPASAPIERQQDSFRKPCLARSIGAADGQRRRAVEVNRYWVDVGPEALDGQLSRPHVSSGTIPLRVTRYDSGTRPS